MKRTGQGVSGERALLVLQDTGARVIRREGHHHIMGLLAMLHHKVAMVGLEEVITGPGSQEDQRLLRTIANTTETTKPICGRLEAP